MRLRKIIVIALVHLTGLSCSFLQSVVPTEPPADIEENSTATFTATVRVIPSITPSPSIQATAILPEANLVAFFPFEGNPMDTSGYENHATLFGPVPAADRFGRPDSAYYFDGVDDFMVIQDNDSLEFTRDFSIALWVKPLRGTEDTSLILSKFPPDGVRQVDAWWYGIAWDWNNRLRFSTAPDYNHETTSQRGLPEDTWTCAVFTYHASDRVWVFYLDGVKDAEGTNFRKQYGTTADITIGSYGNGHNLSMFFGTMDDLAIYQSTLSPQEAQMYCLNNPYDINNPAPAHAPTSTP